MEEDDVNLGADKEDRAGAGPSPSEEERFEPTEDELVLHFLRPQLRGFAPRVAGAVVEADPCAAAPWDLLAWHGLRGRGQGYFFAARRRRGRHLVRRSVGGSDGGSWMRSATKDDGRSVTELGVVVRWCRVRYCFYVRGGELGQMRSTGWVMAEYEITDPRCYRRAEDGEEDEYWVLCHVRKSSRSGRGVSSPKGSKTLAAEGCASGYHELDRE